MKKILLDENLPIPLKKDFSESFDVKTVAEMDWITKQNGELLTAMEDAGFDILMTVDKNLQYQQNLEKHNLKVVVLRTYDNRYKTLQSFVSTIEEAILKDDSEDKVLEIDLRE